MEIVKFGNLYLDDDPLMMDVLYKPNSDIRIGNTAYSESPIEWVKVHEALYVARRYLLSYISWSELDEQGFVYLSGYLLDDYLHDMEIVQEYAEWNRNAMADTILKAMELHLEDRFTTVHNYIDTENMILRKGAVSAQAGERLIIPINMRDGSLICIGKGNPDWNYSAPHGAGRLYSRAKAKELFSLDEFHVQMSGVYTTSVGQSTLDECPMAYRDMASIVENIEPTAEIQKIIRPIYNFKARNEAGGDLVG